MFRNYMLLLFPWSCIVDSGCLCFHLGFWIAVSFSHWFTIHHDLLGFGRTIGAMSLTMLRLLDRSWQMNNTTLLCQSSSNLNWSEDNTEPKTGISGCQLHDSRSFLTQYCKNKKFRMKLQCRGCNPFIPGSSEIIIKLANGSMDSSTGRWQWWFTNWSRTKLQQIRMN